MPTIECMRFPAVLAILLAVSIVLIWVIRRRKASTASSSKSQGTLIRPFRCQISRENEIRGNESFEVFKVQVRGTVRAPADGYPCKPRVRFFDSTDSSRKPLPVYTLIDEFSRGQPPVFDFLGEEIVIPFATSAIPEWITLVELPLEGLLFPYSGKRSLQAVVQILSTDQKTPVLAEADATIAFNSRQEGYRDHWEKRIKSLSLSIRLALVVGACDGELPDPEFETVQNWLVQQAEKADSSEERKLIEQRLNDALQKTLDDIFGEGIEIEATCSQIRETTTKAELYETMALCLKVAGADGIAKAIEMDYINYIALSLDLDTERYKAMVEKELPLDMHERQTTESILGIHQNMSKEEIRKCLNQEYKKWSGRVTHLDPKKRRESEVILQMLAEARKQYLK